MSGNPHSRLVVGLPWWIEQCQGQGFVLYSAASSVLLDGSGFGPYSVLIQPSCLLAGFSDCCEWQDSTERLISSAGISEIFPQLTQLRVSPHWLLTPGKVRFAVIAHQYLVHQGTLC